MGNSSNLSNCLDYDNPVDFHEIDSENQDCPLLSVVGEIEYSEQLQKMQVDEENGRNPIFEIRNSTSEVSFMGNVLIWSESSLRHWNSPRPPKPCTGRHGSLSGPPGLPAAARNAIHWGGGGCGGNSGNCGGGGGGSRNVVTLCRRAQVSRAWNVLALDGSNWQRIDLFDFQRDIEGRTTDATCTSLSKFCSKLKHLDLASCTSVTHMSLKALNERCPLLEQLNISWCDQVTKDGIQALVRGCGGLKALFLKGCPQLEDEALKYIGAHCPELVTLNLQTCLQITDEDLITICRGCHKLQSLCASGCSNITDAILNALDDGICHLGNGACAHDQLEVIELDNCPLITDVSLEHLKSCHSLERIELYDCQQITRAEIKRLRTHLPDIKVHAYFASVTPPPSAGGSRQRFCRCCIIL
ncbi:hypothetical protein P7K49_000687 [Saguinus oedipus]|uniref:F-box/LRR-repeat protein 15-like leucin rich repeat domain-containing protein n=1 Tax=Saguinus oedipus TaxID=9490 RepID=A0ABQ9WD99_SAGOE|nr:hypothetical protein P7K49_000687 [Saguinus oedipus]